MKNLTVSIYSFEELIQGNYLYVDKTAYLWKLVQPRKGFYFYARPRRFGKSLTLSTLEAIFQGRRELFRGLAIYDKPYDWKSYPIIHLDNANCGAQNAEQLQAYFHATINNIARHYGLELRGESLATDFQFLLEDMSQTAPVVVLLDEYDKPVLSNITNPQVKDVLAVLKDFYSVIKQCERRIRFVLVTGVTKFCHVSLFSDLNNLQDISMNADYATMLGYTQEELETNFQTWLTRAEAGQSLPHDEYLAQIKAWYDGYRFHQNACSVYNPVSLANFFMNGGEFRNYWFETGTPSFLMELCQKRKFNFNDLRAETVPAYTFNSFELDDIDPVALLYQTGYLTICGTEVKYGHTNFWLDFPNCEVSESFSSRILNAYSKRTQREIANFCEHLADAVTEGNLPKFQRTLEVFFAGIPYDVHHKSEANFQNIFFAIFRLLGYNVHSESRTIDGRIDAVVETDRYIYLFEFKLNRDDSALSQIREKEYFKTYLLSPKKITLVGVNFDTETGRLSDWKTEAVD